MASGMIHKSGMGATSTVAWVVMLASQEAGTAASITHRSHRFQLTGASKRRAAAGSGVPPAAGWRGRVAAYQPQAMASIATNP